MFSATLRAVRSGQAPGERFWEVLDASYVTVLAPPRAAIGERVVLTGSETTELRGRATSRTGA